jgi:hypothetical protein
MVAVLSDQRALVLANAQDCLNKSGVDRQVDGHRWGRLYADAAGWCAETTSHHEKLEGRLGLSGHDAECRVLPRIGRVFPQLLLDILDGIEHAAVYVHEPVSDVRADVDRDALRLRGSGRQHQTESHRDQHSCLQPSPSDVGSATAGESLLLLPPMGKRNRGHPSQSVNRRASTIHARLTRAVR